MNRRRFVRWTMGQAVLAAPLAAWVGCQKEAPAPTPAAASLPPVAPEKRLVLTALEWTTLDALTEVLIPRTDTPGARDAGVVAFLDWALSQDYFANYRKAIGKALTWLNAQASAQGSQTFADLPPLQQQALTTALSQKQAQAFTPLLSLCMEGYFGDPVYGGNHREAAWHAYRIHIHAPRPGKPYAAKRFRP